MTAFRMTTGAAEAARQREDFGAFNGVVTAVAFLVILWLIVVRRLR